MRETAPVDLTDAAIDAHLDALASGAIRLQGGATSEAGWSIEVTADGTWLRADWHGQERDVAYSSREDARAVLAAHGPQIVVRRAPRP